MWRQLESHKSNRNIRKKQELLSPCTIISNKFEREKKWLLNTFHLIFIKKEKEKCCLYVLLPSSFHFNRHSGVCVCVCVLVKPIFSVDVRSTPIVWCWFSRAEMDRTKLFEKKSGAADCGIQFLFFFLAAHRHERKEIPQREKLS
jgi:hypothetical protein